MSVIFTKDDCVLISHQNFIDKIYGTNQNVEVFENCIDAHQQYKLNPLLFDINSSYRRNNQISDENPSDGKKQKVKSRKRIFPHESATESNGNIEILIETIKEKTGNFLIQCLTDGRIAKKPNDSAGDDRNDAAQKFTSALYSESSSTSPCILNGRNDLDIPIVTSIQNETYLIPPKCQFYQHRIENMEQLTSELYDFIVIDPPWSNKFIKRARHAHSECSYHSLDNNVILNLPIENLTKPNSIVAIWCTNSPSHIAALKTKLLPKWNLKLLSIWYWIKITKYGETVCPFNLPLKKQPFEQLFISCHEASDLQPNIKHISETKYFFSIPSAIHSHKPPLIDLFRNYLPTNPMSLELFARYLLPGFTSVGLETLKLQNLKLYTTSTTSNEIKMFG